MRELTAKQKLRNLETALVDDIMEMSEEELVAELKEDGLDPDEMVARVKEIFRKAIMKAAT